MFSSTMHPHSETAAVPSSCCRPTLSYLFDKTFKQHKIVPQSLLMAEIQHTKKHERQFPSGFSLFRTGERHEGPISTVIKRAVDAQRRSQLHRAIAAARKVELDTWEKDPYVRKLRRNLKALSWYALVYFHVRICVSVKPNVRMSRTHDPYACVRPVR